MVEITNNVSQMVMQKIENLQNFQGDLKFPNAEKIKVLANRIKKKWFSAPIFVREKDDDNVEKFILDWHQRLKALLLLQEEGFELVDGVPCVYIRASTEQEARERVLEYNSSYSSIDVHYLQEVFMLELDVEDIHIYESNVKLLPFDAPAIGEPQALKGSLVDTFIIPPFSVLDTKQGYWVERKRAWNEVIDILLPEDIEKKTDPVLAEIMVRWFCPNNGKVFDCFEEDAVFNFVSKKLGNEVTNIVPEGKKISEIALKNNSQDMFFTCLSFDENEEDCFFIYNDIKKAFSSAINCLKEDRFAIVVASNTRNGEGVYNDICWHITKVMEWLGLCFYNDIVLLNSVGIMATRAWRFFNSNRKVWRCHQQVLVYYKGNLKNIKSNFEPLDFSNLEDLVS